VVRVPQILKVHPVIITLDPVWGQCNMPGLSEIGDEITDPCPAMGKALLIRYIPASGFGTGFCHNWPGWTTDLKQANDSTKKKAHGATENSCFSTRTF